LTAEIEKESKLNRVTGERVSDPYVRVRIAPKCKFCLVGGHVTIETTVCGDIAVVQWFCERCQRKWPMLLGEMKAERRVGAGDRRKRSRSDRRKRQK
jgi:hypothetical protein